jgi:hypothetical protein
MAVSFRRWILFDHHSLSFVHTCPVQVLQAQRFFLNFTFPTVLHSELKLSYSPRTATYSSRQSPLDILRECYLQKPAAEALYYDHEDNSASADADAHFQTARTAQPLLAQLTTWTLPRSFAPSRPYHTQEHFAHVSTTVRRLNPMLPVIAFRLSSLHHSNDNHNLLRS